MPVTIPRLCLQGNVGMLAMLVETMPPDTFAVHRHFALIQAASGGEPATVGWLRNTCSICILQCPPPLVSPTHKHIPAPNQPTPLP